MKNSTVSDHWFSIIQSALAILEKDEAYGRLSPKEKLLMFYYCHFDNLVISREFIVGNILDTYNPLKLFFNLRKYKEIFLEIIDPIVDEAIAEGNLKSLSLMNRSYNNFFWAQHLFVLRYWVTDTSRDFELTTALIEKVINSTFDFMGKGKMTSSLDFWKFVFQNPIKIRIFHE